MFKVVQEQELVLVTLRGCEQFEERLGSTLCQSKCVSDGWNDEGRVTDGCQVDHMNAIGEVTYQFLEPPQVRGVFCPRQLFR